MLVVKNKLFIASVSLGMSKGLIVPCDAADEEEARKIVDMLIAPHGAKYKIELLAEIKEISRIERLQ